MEAAGCVHYTSIRLSLSQEFLRNRLNKSATKLNRWQGRTEAVVKGAGMLGAQNWEDEKNIFT